MASNETVTTDEHTKEGTANEPSKDTIDSNTSILDMELPPVTEQDDNYEGSELPEIEPENEPEPVEVHDHDNGGESLRGTLDDKNGAYDPAVHSFPAEKTPTGKWKKISKAKLSEKPAEEIAENSNASVRLEAQKAAALYSSLHLGIFGAENGRSTSPAYNMMLIDSFETYMNENGVTKMPPSIDALFSMGLFTLDISSKKENSGKVKGWVTGGYSKIKGLFSKKPKSTTEKQPEVKEVVPSA